MGLSQACKINAIKVSAVIVSQEMEHSIIIAFKYFAFLSSVINVSREMRHCYVIYVLVVEYSPTPNPPKLLSFSLLDSG
jgi:hypothetical protein